MPAAPVTPCRLPKGARGWYANPGEPGSELVRIRPLQNRFLAYWCSPEEATATEEVALTLPDGSVDTTRRVTIYLKNCGLLHLPEVRRARPHEVEAIREEEPLPPNVEYSGPTGKKFTKLGPDVVVMVTEHPMNAENFRGPSVAWVPRWVVETGRWIECGHAELWPEGLSQPQQQPAAAA
jgi:hypothetical protein